MLPKTEHRASDLELIIPNLLLLVQQSPALQIIYNLLDAVLDALLVASDMDLGILGRLVRRTDARKLWDLALSCLLVQALGIARLGYFER